MTPKQYRQIRDRLGLTQAELGARLGVSRDTIHRRETGDAPITPEAAMALRAMALRALKIYPV